MHIYQKRLMVVHDKCMATEIALFVLKQFGGTITHPPYMMTVKMAAAAIVLQGGPQETQFPLLTSLGVLHLGSPKDLYA